MRSGILPVIFGIYLLFNSCKTDRPDETVSSIKPNTSSKVWVSNEGLFQLGNAALGIYQTTTNQYSAQVVQNQNNEALGDILQSISFIEDLGYLVINNSGKIVIVDTSNFDIKGSITGFTSPRYILDLGGSKAYVSDLYADAISIIDRSTKTITGKIKCGSWTEKMLSFNEKVFVSAPGNEYLYVLNSNSDILTDSLKLAYGSNSLVLDKDDNLWVLCSGSISNDKSAALFKIDPIALSIVDSIPLNKTKSPSHLMLSKQSEDLYFIYKDIVKLSVSNGNDSIEVFYPAGNKTIYGLNQDPNSGDFYIADAKDYVQKGMAYILSSSGALKSSFTTDINPNGFYFP